MDNTDEEELVQQRAERTDEVALLIGCSQETSSFDVQTQDVKEILEVQRVLQTSAESHLNLREDDLRRHHSL